MNPMLSAALTSIVRWVLMIGAAWLVKHGVWTPGDASSYVGAAAIALVTLGWSQHNVWKQQVKLLIALMLPKGSTMDHVNEVFHSDEPKPTVMTPPNTPPGVPILVLLVLLGGLTVPLVTPGCASQRPVTIVTPQGQAAWTADSIVKRLTEISNVVKDDTGSRPGNIKPADAFTIIEWISGDAHATPPTIGIAQIVAASVDGTWKTAARASWQTRIRPIFQNYASTAPYVTIVDSILDLVL